MRVAILGFGVEGRDATSYFLQRKAEITVFDKKEKEEIDTKEFDTAQITWVCGENYLAGGLPNFDVIVRSPGIRPDLPEIEEAIKNGAELTSTTKIFFEECNKPIIGVTGTKGKGTTSSLIAEGLKACGKKVVLLGNIGEPMLASLDHANQSDYIVLELSSFQTMDLTKSPHVAVITNITQDHMDWHKDLEEYHQAKRQLWVNQTGRDYLIVGWNDGITNQLARHAPGIIERYSLSRSEGALAYINTLHDFNEKEDTHSWEEEIIVYRQRVGFAKELKIPGAHNLSNTLAALCTIQVLQEDVQKAWQGMTKFEGLEHRLEKVTEIDGVLYINDSYATNPEPTLAAIRSYSEPKILILGGSSKEADFTQMAQELSEKRSQVKAVVLIGDEGKKIKEALQKAGFEGEMVDGGKTMTEIVEAAKKLAQKGDVVLLSPACASFGLFQNYKDRGKQFKDTVKKLAAS